MADDPKLERLASLELEAALPEETLAEVADLCLRLHQSSARRAGAILARHMVRSYADRTETERLGMRAAVGHVVNALVFLQLVDFRP